ncbi:hypothetical protein HQ520_06045, partial [bacterium]|nr:hypothetical protein [bacterium]
MGTDVHPEPTDGRREQDGQVSARASVPLLDRAEVLRKVYHFFGGLITPGIYLFLTKSQMIPVAAFFMAGVLAFEIARLRIPAFRMWVEAFVPIRFKEFERRRLAGQAFLQIGFFVAILIAQKEVAILAMV